MFRVRCRSGGRDGGASGVGVAGTARVSQGLLPRYAARDHVRLDSVAVSDSGVLPRLAAVVRMGALPGLAVPVGLSSA